MTSALPRYDAINLAGKAILMRVDFNIPPDAHGNLADTYRLEAHLPGIKELLAKGARLGLLTHRGRPQGDVVPHLSTKPLAEELSRQLGQAVHHVPDCIGRMAEQAMAELPPGQVLLFENTRFHLGEQVNDAAFVRHLAKLGEVFVNDAFAAAHRPHASMSGLAATMPTSVLGPLMLRELDWLQTLQADAPRPLSCIIGGTQVAAKLDLIAALMTRVDTLMLAGAVAHTFLASRDMGLGRSLLDPGSVERARDIFAEAGVVGCRLLLPQDFTVQNKQDGTVTAKPFNKLSGDDMAMDIGPQTCETWRQVIGKSARSFWLGSVGNFEHSPFDTGCRTVAEGLLAAEGFTLAAGDGLLKALKPDAMRTRLPHVSSGAAVWLHALAGKPLPALQVLRR
ncbi:MAG: phosphoglycerate kinase [Pseudomonadaceae bacterium]|nr:phosphoglycerate kinase [Pseudomonadaceae bacterium]